MASTAVATTTTTAAPSTASTAPPATTQRPTTTVTTVPGTTTTTAPGFTPPEGVAPAPGDASPAAGPIEDAGTGALPIFVALSIAGLTTTAAIMAVRWWQTRPG